jgi:hypothetical protein
MRNIFETSMSLLCVLLFQISSLEQEVKEKYQSSVFQHSLQDRTAALDLESVAWEVRRNRVQSLGLSPCIPS